MCEKPLKAFTHFYCTLTIVANYVLFVPFLLLQKYDQGILVENMIISNMSHIGDGGGNGAEYEGHIRNYDLARSCVMLYTSIF